MSTKKDKPESRVSSLLPSKEALAQELKEQQASSPVFLPKSKQTPVESREPVAPAQVEPPDALPQAESPAPKEERKTRTSKPGVKLGRPRKDESRKKAEGEVVCSIRMDAALLERVNAYVDNKYALYQTKADLLRYALPKALEELEPLLKKAEKLYETHLGKGKSA